MCSTPCLVLPLPPHLLVVLVSSMLMLVSLQCLYRLSSIWGNFQFASFYLVCIKVHLYLLSPVLSLCTWVHHFVICDTTNIDEEGWRGREATIPENKELLVQEKDTDNLLNIHL